MHLETLEILSLTDDPALFSNRIGESFRSFGFAIINDHGIDAQLISLGWELTQELFVLPEEEKLTYYRESLSGARGYTPFGKEAAKDAKAHDLKEFWHVGRELPAGHSLSANMPANLWPSRPTKFRETFAALFAEFDRVGNLILSRIATYLDLPSDWFAPVTADGNSVLRMLHYPPIQNAQVGAIRAAAHEDINFITLLLGAEEAGLELQTRDGQWLSVSAPDGALVVNIGDMLQRLTNAVLPSTTHRVRNPDPERTGASRYSMPFFLHPRSDFSITTLPNCITPDNPDRYPEAITADEYLQQRLREIGLMK